MRPTALKTLIGRKRHRRELAAERESQPQRLVLLRFHRYPLFFQRFFYFDRAPSSPAPTLFDRHPGSLSCFYLFTLRVATCQRYEPSKSPPLYLFMRDCHAFTLADQSYSFTPTLRTTLAITLCLKPFALVNLTGQ